jgi:shikimate kinase
MKLSVHSDKNILFIGFMGSGKSQIGRAVSKKTGKLFLDSDLILESRENRKILDIFKSDGESYFRNLEVEFGEQIKSSISNSVISLGGGFPTAVSNLKELGFVIYLDIDFDIMLSEISKYPDELEKRPLLQDLKRAREIYESRKEIYLSQSNLRLEVIPTNLNKTVSEIVNSISKRV